MRVSTAAFAPPTPRSLPRPRSSDSPKHSLRRLRPSGALATLETRLLEAQAGNFSALDFLSSLLQDETNLRHSRLLQEGFKRSGLPERTPLAELRLQPGAPKRACFERNTLKFITEGLNAVLVGHTGTGKNHVAQAIDYSAVREGLGIVYVEADDLLVHLALTVGDLHRQTKRH